MLVHVLFELNGALCSEMFMYECRVEKEKGKKKKKRIAKPGERGQGNLILHELECSCIALSVIVHSSKNEAQKGNA